MTDIDVPEAELSLRVADGFCNEFKGFIYCLEEDCFYMYLHGYYKKIFMREMQDIVLTRKSFAKKLTLQGLKNVIDRIATIKQCRLDKFNNHDFLNFENGLFDVNCGSLNLHSQDVISTLRLPYKYDPLATCPLWNKTLNEIMENDKNKIRTLQESFGYCLTRETKHEKALILTGEGANGKSTILNTLKAVVGSDNCTSLSLRYFNDPVKATLLMGKLVNICGEIPKRVEDFEAEFKSIVTGEEVLVNPKFVAPFVIRPYCKVVMAINEFPHIDDKTSAFYRRLLILELNKQFSEEEQNKDLRDQLLSELPGIFNWSYEGLKRLRERGNFLVDEYMRHAIENIKESNNPLISWANENILILKGDELFKSEAFEHYKRWSDTNGYKPYGMAKFSSEVYKIFSRRTEKDRRNKTRLRIWPNLAMRTPENELRASQNQEEVKWDQ